MRANNKPEFWILTGTTLDMGEGVVRATKKSGANILAMDVIELMAEMESGKSWVRLRTDKPRYVIRAPGDKTG